MALQRQLTPMTARPTDRETEKDVIPASCYRVRKESNVVCLLKCIPIAMRVKLMMRELPVSRISWWKRILFSADFLAVWVWLSFLPLLMLSSLTSHLIIFREDGPELTFGSFLCANFFWYVSVSSSCETHLYRVELEFKETRKTIASSTLQKQSHHILDSNHSCPGCSFNGVSVSSKQGNESCDQLCLEILFDRSSMSDH